MRSVIKTAVVLVAGVLIGGSPAHAQKTGRYAQADLAQRYKRANEAMPKVEDAFARKDYATAKREAAAILATLPEHSGANFMMAKIAYVEKDYTAALESMEKAKATHSLLSDTLREAEQDRLSELRRRRTDQEAVISELQGQLAVAPVTEQAQLRLKLAHAEQIVEDIDRVLADPPIRTEESSVPAGYFFFHGNILLRLQRYEEAKQQYAAALRLNPGYSDAANNLASLHFAAREYEKALEVLKEVEKNGAAVNQELKSAILRALGR